MTAKGMFLGYDAQNQPIACALYGVYGETKASARRFCSTPGLEPRDFPEGDPNTEVEMARFREHATK
jgi:hypothetical protein